MCSVWIAEQTAIISLYSIKVLFFKTGVVRVYCAVRAEPHITSSIQTQGKSRIHPIVCHEGTEEDYMYRSFISLTSVLDRGGWSTPRTGRFGPEE